MGQPHERTGELGALKAMGHQRAGASLAGGSCVLAM
jgi:hypothetical protein